MQRPVPAGSPWRWLHLRRRFCPAAQNKWPHHPAPSDVALRRRPPPHWLRFAGVKMFFAPHLYLASRERSRAVTCRRLARSDAASHDAPPVQAPAAFEGRREPPRSSLAPRLPTPRGRARRATRHYMTDSIFCDEIYLDNEIAVPSRCRDNRVLSPRLALPPITGHAGVAFCPRKSRNRTALEITGTVLRRRALTRRNGRHRSATACPRATPRSGSRN
jgi:hypothetical protein